MNYTSQLKQQQPLAKRHYRLTVLRCEPMNILGNTYKLIVLNLCIPAWASLVYRKTAVLAFHQTLFVAALM